MEIIAKKREIAGKKVKTLRRENIIPAIMFGKGIPSVPLEVNLSRFNKVYKEVGESSLLDLKVEGEATPVKVLISEVQYSAVNLYPIHASFHKVNLKEKLKAEIPVVIVGEASAVKEGKGILITLIDEIEVECFPADLPKEFLVDVSSLQEVNDFVAVKDLTYNKEKVVILHLDSDELVVKIDFAQQLEEVAPVTSVEDIEVTKEKPKEEVAEEGKEGKPASKGEAKPASKPEPKPKA